MHTIKTSDRGWIQTIAKAYRDKENICLIDDADVGIDPQRDTILQMGRRVNLQTRDWVAVLISLGVAMTGAYLLVMAIVDPEPFSKIGLSLTVGAVLIGGGGLTAVRVLTHIKPPNVKVTSKGFEISWG